MKDARDKPSLMHALVYCTYHPSDLFQTTWLLHMAAPVAYDAVVCPRQVGRVYQILHQGHVAVGQIPGVMAHHVLDLNA